MRPSTCHLRDKVYGLYNVKTGYYAQSQIMKESHPEHIQECREEQKNLFKMVWKLNAPPKIKTFWWKVVHNRLPVATQLNKRGVRVDSLCLMCGEEKETVNHVLFQCRVVREVWELAPVNRKSGDLLSTQELFQKEAKLSP